MAICPYCSNIVFRQVCQQGVSWFCRHCWTEIPPQVIQSQQLSDQHREDEQSQSLPAEHRGSQALTHCAA